MGMLYMEYDDEMHYVIFSASDIGYDPTHNLCLWVYAYIYMKGMHGLILIHMRDYIMTWELTAYMQLYS